MYEKATIPLAISAILCLGSVASAQTYIGDSGQAAATAPGGTEGIDGRANVREAIQDGDAVSTAPGVGVEAERRLPRAVEDVPPQR